MTPWPFDFDPEDEIYELPGWDLPGWRANSRHRHQVRITQPSGVARQSAQQTDCTKL